MNDRDLMENILLLEKGVCDLFMHGAIESSSSDVQQAFSSSLNSSLNMQSQIYDKMQSRGWYSADQADQSKMDSLRMKYSETNSSSRQHFCR